MDTNNHYYRIEYVSDIGFGERVIAFVDFSNQGISFGIPKHVRIMQGTPQNKTVGTPAIDVYQRITAHRDGRIDTHLPITQGQHFDAPWDGQRNPLNQWQSPWSMQEELIWSEDYLNYTRDYYTMPYTHPRAFTENVRFDIEAKASTIVFIVSKPEDMNGILSTVPNNPKTWILSGGWPWVGVGMSNTDNPNRIEYNDVARDYR